jgi:iron complex outermembrane receptor protein
MTINDKPETRIIRISFTYRFGNISLKGIMKHNAGNEEEQNRAGGVAGNATGN